MGYFYSVWIESSMISSFSSLPLPKVLCYLQNKKIWVGFLQNNTWLQTTTTCIELQVEQIFSVNIEYIYFFNFLVLLLCYFQKLQRLVIKNLWNNFCCTVLLFVWAQKMCLRFLKCYFKLESNILVLRGVLLSRFAQLKSYFSEESTSAVNSEPHFCREAINV